MASSCLWLSPYLHLAGLQMTLRVGICHVTDTQIYGCRYLLVIIPCPWESQLSFLFWVLLPLAPSLVASRKVSSYARGGAHAQINIGRYSREFYDYKLETRQTPSDLLMYLNI